MLTVLIVVCAILLALLIAGVPVAFALGLAGLVGLWMTYHGPTAFDQLPSIAISQLNFITSSLPLYVLFGELFLFAGAGRDAFRAADAWLRRVPGGLGVAVVGASALMAAVTGATTASINTFGPAAVREAEAIGYSRTKIVGALAAAGTLGILIPPSISMILYSSVTGVSLGDLFTAGFIPGVLLTAGMAAYLVIVDLFERRRVRGSRAMVLAADGGARVPAVVPSLARAQPAHHHFEALAATGSSGAGSLMAGDDLLTSNARANRLAVTLRAVPAGLGVVLVLGSIYSGFATPTEAAGVGGAYALLLALFELRRGDFAAFKQALVRTASTSAMMMFLLISAQIFSQVLILQNVPQRLTSAVAGASIGRWGVLILIMLALAAVGLVMNPGPTILITMPVVYPLLQRLGFDGVWFGVLLVVKLELAALTPPIGINLYITKGVTGVKFGEVVRSVLPYWWIIIAALVVLAAFPQISLWLPSVLSNGR